MPPTDVSTGTENFPVVFVYILAGALVLVIILAVIYGIRQDSLKQRPAVYRLIENTLDAKRPIYKVQENRGGRGWKHIEYFHTLDVAVAKYEALVEQEAHRQGQLGDHDRVLDSTELPPPPEGAEPGRLSLPDEAYNILDTVVPDDDWEV